MPDPETLSRFNRPLDLIDTGIVIDDESGEAVMPDGSRCTAPCMSNIDAWLEPEGESGMLRVLVRGMGRDYQKLLDMCQPLG